MLAVTSAINGWGSLLSEDHKEILALFRTEIVFELKILNYTLQQKETIDAQIIFKISLGIDMMVRGSVTTGH